MLSSPLPYVLDTPAFRFGKLAAYVGRAPVGGGREVALAAYVAARMVHDMLADRHIAREFRRERATAAKSWLSSMALAVSVKTAFAELLAATGGEASDIGPLLRRVIAVTAESLDGGARLELERLAMAIEAQPVGRQ